MGTLNSALSIAVSSLTADQAALDVTTNNVANAETPGYSRQRAIFAENPSLVMSPLTYGTGVSLQQVQSVRDPILQLRIQQEMQQQGSADAFVPAMQQVEVMFNQTTGGDIGTQISNFFSSVNQLSTDPTNQSLRQGVLTAAGNLANAFRTTSSTLSSQKSNLDLNVAQTVQQVNTLTGQIAKLNGQITTMENVGQGINVTNFYIMEGEVRTGEQPVSKTTPVFRNIAISHMTINGARLAINIEGLPEMPVAGLRISDVIASGKAGLKAFNTVGLELHNVQVNAESGPAFLVRDSKELELDHVTSRKPLADVPVIRLDHCTGAIVRDSRAFAGTGTFLSTGPGALRGLILEGNVLGGARKPTEEVKADFWKEAEPPTEGEGASR